MPRPHNLMHRNPTSPNQGAAAVAARVAIVDDHVMVAHGLKLLIEQRTGFQVVAAYASATAALEGLAQEEPEIALVDVELPDFSGLELARRIVERHPGVRVAIITSDTGSETIAEALAAGVSGYLIKDCTPIELECALRAVQAGETFLCPKATRVVMDQMRNAGAPAGAGNELSRRELEVLRRIAAGLSTKEVAHELDISVKTAETYRRRLMRKLDLRSVADLTRYAIRRGYVQP